MLNHFMNSKIINWIMIFFLLGFITYQIQFIYPLHNDNAFFFYAAQKWLMAGTYTNDFFDTNPPLIILLNLPVVLIAKMTSLNLRSVFYLYILFFALGSLAISSYLLKKIIDDRVIFYFGIAGIAFALLLLPNISFGQREHLLVIFSLPYLSSAILRLSNKKIPLLLAITIGIFAGLGFALKPNFLITFILIELFFIYQTKNIIGCVRAESLCVLSVIAIYVYSVYQFFPDYLHTVLPLLLKYYPTELPRFNASRSKAEFNFT